MTFALHSPSEVAGYPGYLVSEAQRWEHFEYVRRWRSARKFGSVLEAQKAAEETRHAVNVITEGEWREIGGR